MIEAGISWRAEVAALPHNQWVRWRLRSGELQARLRQPLSAEDIQRCDYMSYAELASGQEGEALESTAKPIRVRPDRIRGYSQMLIAPVASDLDQRRPYDQIDQTNRNELATTMPDPVFAQLPR